MGVVRQDPDGHAPSLERVPNAHGRCRQRVMVSAARRRRGTGHHRLLPPSGSVSRQHSWAPSSPPPGAAVNRRCPGSERPVGQACGVHVHRRPRHKASYHSEPVSVDNAGHTMPHTCAPHHSCARLCRVHGGHGVVKVHGARRCGHPSALNADALERRYHTGAPRDCAQLATLAYQPSGCTLSTAWRPRAGCSGLQRTVRKSPSSRGPGRGRADQSRREVRRSMDWSPVASCAE